MVPTEYALAVRSFYLQRQTEEMLWSTLPLMPIWCPAKFKPLGMEKRRPFLPSLPHFTQNSRMLCTAAWAPSWRGQRDQSYLVGPGTAAFLRGCVLPRGALVVGRFALWGTGAWQG